LAPPPPPLPPPPPFELAAATLCAHGSGAITRFSFLSHVEHTKMMMMVVSFCVVAITE